MDFFDRQDRARRITKWLVLYFVAAVVLMVLGLYGVFAGLFLRDRLDQGFEIWRLWHPQLFLGVAGGTCGVVFLGSLYRMATLRRGGAAVAEMLGGRRIASNTNDTEERLLLNVVEEMALASGMAVPPIYLLPDEEAINAFAAGNTPNDAVIGVTRGCVKRMNRDELQGVIAHEFSHILNGDMRLNLRLMGVIFGILCLASIGRVLLRSGFRGSSRMNARSSDKGGNPQQVIGLALLLLGSIGVFFGRLIQAAVSRQREFLADAAAVQFTRNPAGIAGALKKIGGLDCGSRLETPHASEASHLFFASALRSSFFGLMATHPPLVDRIRAIDPHFDGQFPVVEADERPSPAVWPEAAASLDAWSGSASVSANRRSAVPATSALRQTGSPQPAHLEEAIAWRASLPEPLRGALRDPARAPMVAYALLFSSEETVRDLQREALASLASPEVCQFTAEMSVWIGALPTAARLPLADLTIPALREMPADHYAAFRSILRRLIEADRQIDLFEYALEKCLDRHLAPVFEGSRRDVIQYYALSPLLGDITCVLSLLARLGHLDAAAGSKAYADALQSLGLTPTERPQMCEESSGLAQADLAFRKLAQATPAIRRQFLQAVAHAVASDGELATREAEMLRAAADAVDCPIPPFIELYRRLEEPAGSAGSP